MTLELNRIYNMDCLKGMKEIDEHTIDLVVTSPPIISESSMTLIMIKDLFWNILNGAKIG